MKARFAGLALTPAEAINLKWIQRSIVALLVAGALLLGLAGPAAAQRQAGLVNVNIGDITIEDVNVGVAAQIAANVCGVAVGPVAILAEQVVRSGETRTVCQSDQGPVTISPS
jgi:hypothetical protein